MTTLERVPLAASDGHEFNSVRVTPEGRCRGGLVVVQTASGLSPYLCDVCSFFARHGYAAIAPALYDRQRPNAIFDRSPEAAAEAGRLRRGLIWEEVLADIGAARVAAGEYGPVGIVGFCVGGSAAWLAASTLNFKAAVSYYGKDIVDFLDCRPTCPVMLHFGSEDPLIPEADVQRVSNAFPDIRVHLYPASHGFDDPEHGYTTASELARQRTVNFLDTHIG